MAKLPKPKDTTVSRIYKSYEGNQANRPHLGASILGDECQRKLWYIFRWAKAPSFEGRMIRLFNRGFAEEHIFLKELRKIGVEVWERDPRTGKQFVCSFAGGHAGGSCDGVAKGLMEAPKTPHLLEFKTSSKKYFGIIEKDGVEKAKPEHFAQMQIYMHFLDLKRAFYMVVCKDDDHLYSERIHYDKKAAEKLVKKAERIINFPTPMVKLSDDPSFWKCKFCHFLNICHHGEIPDVNCRTCLHSTPEVEGDGRWSCTGFNEDSIPISSLQTTECKKHLFIPDLLPWPVVTAGEDWVEYKGGLINKGNSSEIKKGGM